MSKRREGRPNPQRPGHRLLPGSLVVAVCRDCDRSWTTATTGAASSGTIHAQWSGHRVVISGHYRCEYAGLDGDQRGPEARARDEIGDES